MVESKVQLLGGSLLINEPVSTSVFLHRGFWKIECWGASGGDSFKTSIYKSYPGGRGGYSIGVLILEEDSTVFLNVGGRGVSNATGEQQRVEGGFNGGGSGFIGSLGYPVGSGGGSTDIRVGGDNYSYRVIVAGGGGGAGAGNTGFVYGQFGGSGGGLQGSEGGGKNSLYDQGGGKGGNQTAGGDRGYSSENTIQFGEDGSQFFGGNGSVGHLTGSSAGGGGGGYYGGGGSVSCGGGGGSSYIGGVSSYHGIIAKTLSGDTNFPDPDRGIENGHLGHGCIKISSIHSTSGCFIEHFHIISIYALFIFHSLLI